MKIALLQFEPKFGNKEFNLKKIKEKIKNLKFDLLLLPELFSTGYSFLNKEELSEYSEEVPGGETTNFLIEIAKKRNCYIAGGIAEKEKELFFNTAVLITDEELKNCR